jgi:hypothetical protein
LIELGSARQANLVFQDESHFHPNSILNNLAVVIDTNFLILNPCALNFVERFRGSTNS